MASVMSHIGGGLASFFRWWFGELAGLVPRRVRSAVQSTRPALTVRLSEDEMILDGGTVGDAEDAVRIDIKSADTGQTQRRIAAALTNRGSGKADVVLCLPFEDVLFRTLEMPREAEPELQQALTLQIDRLTPFKRDEVCFDYRIIARTPGSRQMTVELAVVPRAAVEEAVDAFEEWGLSPDAIDVIPPGSRHSAGFDLSRGIRAPRESHSLTRLNMALGTVATFLLVAVVYLPFEKKVAVLNSLEARVATARADAESAAKLRREIEQLVADSSFLVEKRKVAPSVLRSLDELTQILPDHTWISVFSQNGDKVQISGLSKAASSLIGLIDRSPYFEKPGFRSPVTEDPRTGLERFGISLEIRKTGGK